MVTSNSILRGGLCIYFSLALFITFAQTKKFVSFTQWGPRDGLASVNVRKIVEDKCGFIWFATQGGLSRHDGSTFINYNSHSANPRRRILNNDVADIQMTDDSSAIVAVTPYGGISVIELSTGNVIDNYPVTGIGNKDSVTVIKCIPSGNLFYIMTDEGFVLLYDRNKRAIVKSARVVIEDKLAYFISAFYLHKDKLMVFVTDGRVEIFNRNDLSHQGSIKLNAGDGIPAVNQVARVDEHTMFLATDHGIRCIDITGMKETVCGSDYSKLISFFGNTDCRDILVNKQDIYVASIKGLYRFTGDKDLIEYLPARYPEQQAEFKKLKRLFCKGNSVWVSSSDGLLFIRNIAQPFTAFYKSYSNDDVKIGHAYGLYSSSDSIVLAAAFDGIYSVNVLNSFIRKIYSGNNVNHIYKLNDDYLIASRTGSTFLVDKNYKAIDIDKVYSELNVLKEDLIIATIKVNDTLTLFGSDNANGIYFWNPKRNTVSLVNTETRPLSLKSNVINSFYLSANREKLFVLCDNRVSVFSPASNKFSHLNVINPVSGMAMNIFMDMCEMDGFYWFAVYGVGIVQFNPDLTIKKIFSVEDGLKDPGVYKIFPIAGNLLAVSSNTGIALLDSKRGRIKMVFESDGLNTDQFEEYSGSYIGGKVFFGGLNGISRIDPGALTVNTKAPVLYFTGVNVQTTTGVIDTSNIGIRKFIVPTNRRQTNIYFVGLNYPDPSAVTYEYRIKEKDTSWVSLGKQNFISIIGLGPGTYSLQIRAANEDGRWSEPANLTLVFLPRWCQTIWFKILLALLVAGIVYAIYRIRIAQLKKEERIRSRLASDLHDDLGSTFNSIKVYSNLALMQPGNTDHLYKIKEGTQDAINGIRDMIWVLDDKRDTVGDILSRIQQFAIPLCKAEGIVFNMNVDAVLNHHKLGKEEKRNLYLILKEAINNSVKYAGCTTISLSIASTGNKLSIAIADNGKGFDPGEMKQGNGLKNIPARAAEIGYRYAISTSKGKGVELRFNKA